MTNPKTSFECAYCGSTSDALYRLQKYCDLKCALFHRVQTNGKCWEWTETTSSGYGYFSLNSVYYRAHRASYFLHYGEIPDEMSILHHCDNPLCVRPSHLYAGFQEDNRRDVRLRHRGLKKLSMEQVMEAERRLMKGETASSIAREFRVSQPAIQRIKLALEKDLERSGSDDARRAFSGHLCDADVSAIREALRNGATQAQLAKRFNTSPTAVCNIAKRRTYKHVP